MPPTPSRPADADAPADSGGDPDPDVDPDVDTNASTSTDAGAADTTPCVVLDTNALMMPVECDVRLFDELTRLGYGDAELLVPEPVVAELEALGGIGDADRAGTGGQERVAARVGRDLVDRCRTVATEETYADDAVVELVVDLLATDDGGNVDATVTPSTDDGTDSGAGDGGGRTVVVVTNDGPLRDRLLERGVRVISLRGRNKLDTTQP
jgi:rRNA-processing protein FCF1